MGGDELHSVTLIFFFFPPFLTEKKKTQQNLITSFCWFSHIDLHYRSSLIYFTNSTHPPSLHLLFSYFIISFLSFLVSSHKSQGSRTKCRGNHQVLPWKWLIVSISKLTRKLVFWNLVLSFSKLYACTQRLNMK
jgi:hypothetical protein